MSKYFVYLARLLSACCFYLFLAKANTWLNKTDNTILAFGYRFFILLAPFVFVMTNRWIAFIAFFVSVVGMLLWFYSQYLLGTILFSSGMAIGGYVIKYHASKTPSGAANNRVALNMGVFLSGLLIFLPCSNQTLILVGLVMMLITLISSVYVKDNSMNNESKKIQKLNFSFSEIYSLRGLAWALVGLITGVKLMSTMTILPQYLIYTVGNLPRWYGLIISMSSLVVILMQIPIMRIMQQFNLHRAFIPLFLSMIMIAFPWLFYCETTIGGMLWAFMLTLFECSVSYLDTFSVKEGTLLIKELFAGIGMALAVVLMRSFDPITAACILGISGAIGTLLAVRMLRVEKIIGKESLTHVWKLAGIKQGKVRYRQREMHFTR